MNCKLVEKHLYDYCDGILPPEIANDIENHLKECNLCNNLVLLTLAENDELANPHEIPKLNDDFNNKVINNLPEQQLEFSHNNTLLDKLKNNFKIPYVIPVAATVLLIIYLAFPQYFLLNDDIRTLTDVESKSETKNGSEMIDKEDSRSVSPDKDSLSDVNIFDQHQSSEKIESVDEKSPPAPKKDEKPEESSVSIMQNDLDSAPKGLGIMTTDDKESSEHLINFPVPAEQINDYKLVKNVPNNGQILYKYKSKEESFILLIKSHTSNFCDKFYSDSHNIYSWTIKVKDNEYQAILKADKSVDELKNIVNDLYFE
ncbi:hypothetical protein SYNTR_0998 [Candidatus Syntrophocurvum alkaliphilum]|uniref:Putative zinc-finger domain-containing protein n=1 Tax=Candidatus Syntrophocurvum alkaliphilum TaxID=2293317 RepID=A0A6I6DJL5_9FIRM|nr:zf-HC2 domain-containing protein [Candidatus Syntrophocurvum alkaliphilum]QGT99591.1 hypothetical protein SYNTR_0998 [Candidatus Syntrophocurvum alkaliphilum]